VPPRDGRAEAGQGGGRVAVGEQQGPAPLVTEGAQAGRVPVRDEAVQHGVRRARELEVTGGEPDLDGGRSEDRTWPADDVVLAEGTAETGDRDGRSALREPEQGEPGLRVVP
jgi:hypothetical protein